ncbi:MAG TPA: hypothetical protein VGL13_06765, partial [Polyangiaceae bacterium]
LPDDGHWRTRGLPQHGFPFALATTRVHPDPARPDFYVDLLKVDPRTIAPMGTSGVEGSAPTVIVFNNIARTAGHHPRLWLDKDAFSITSDMRPGAIELWSGLAVDDASAAKATAGLGVSGEDDMLVYAEASAADDAGKHIDALLTTLGCSTRMLLAHPLSPALGGTTTLDGLAAKPSDAASIRLVRRETKGATTIFDDTPVVPPDIWQPLQSRRIRYFRKPTPPPPSPSPSAPATARPAATERSPNPSTEPIDPFDPN